MLQLELDARGVDPDRVAVLNSLLSEELEEHGLDVIAGDDLRRLVELEAVREKVGCDTGSTSCMAELAGALGVDTVVFGEVGQIGSYVVLTVGVLDASRATVLARETLRGTGYDALVDGLRDATSRLLVAAGLTTAPAPGEAAAPREGFGFAVLAAPWAVVVAGVVVALAGVAVTGFGVVPWAFYSWDYLRYTRASTAAEEAAARESAEAWSARYEPWGRVAWIAGGVVATLAVVVAGGAAVAGVALWGIDDAE